MTKVQEYRPSAPMAVGLRRRVYAERLAHCLDELDEQSRTLMPDEIEASRREWLGVAQVNEGRTTG